MREVGDIWTLKDDDENEIEMIVVNVDDNGVCQSVSTP